MKRFLITYELGLAESPEAWHAHVAEFIAALENEPDLKGRISYRVMKAKDSTTYYHLAEAHDDGAADALTRHAFFKRYTEENKRAAGGHLQVIPLETVAETRF